MIERFALKVREWLADWLFDLTHRDWKTIVTKQFDPVLKPLGLRRISLTYDSKSFGNVLAKYKSDRLELWVVRDRSRWEIRIIPLQNTSDENPYALIREYLGKPYSDMLSDLPQYIVADYETLCHRFSPEEYPGFRAQFDIWARERWNRMHPNAQIE